ncbi:hypothetical protein [Halobacteriovorax sp. CON-3]|uniref:hypothetical protein n=1 Tax=Halobacteriovorax sp. CON-3 TaxID=3157710 RepID=UPI003712481E
MCLPKNHIKFGPHYKAAISTIIFGCAKRNIRKHYLIGSVIGALQAKNIGKNDIALFEFGVASGGGYRVLLDIAELINKYLKMNVRVIGFDNRDGLPEPKDFRDHPEIWTKNQFAMGAIRYEELDNEAKNRNGELIIGDIANTLKNYCPKNKKGEPTTIAFCSIDVDYYSSTTPILEWFKYLDVNYLLPAIPVYFDDVLNNWCYSSKTGEELAINEFNQNNEIRHIELKDRNTKLYALHCLDHPIRNINELNYVGLEIFVKDLKSYYWR